ncbi:porin [Noviherbaspirillum saxi]|uniref:Porin n=1 Tax=Noviherbaspirillum saxi TaxID=2320863 RepID=A0A3A3FLJ2_9BURK|nr:porin [Noviherbaspirillum saxi]RJF92402.1 porin [Noviherbaspirillum saxi]
MKKSLLAFAVLSTLTGVSAAQSAVTVYGLMDLGLVHESGGPGGSALKMESGVTAGSRLGFKGNEDLGGGLSAHFQIESGIAADVGGLNQGGLMYGRQAYVGLKGSFGTINLGRQYNPLTNILGTIDPFGEGHEGAATNIVGYASRMNNTIYYTSPSFGGMTADVAYGLGETPGNSSANRQLGLALTYVGGPIYASVLHHRINDATGNNPNKITLIGGTYNFGFATGALSYNVNKDNAGIDSNDTLVGVTIPFGASAVMASYIRHNDKSPLNRDADQFAVGYTYNLSKRTMLYGSYGSINNKNGATFTVGNAIEAGTGDRGLAIGVAHRF